MAIQPSQAGGSTGGSQQSAATRVGTEGSAPVSAAAATSLGRSAGPGGMGAGRFTPGSGFSGTAAAPWYGHVAAGPQQAVIGFADASGAKEAAIASAFDKGELAQSKQAALAEGDAWDTGKGAPEAKADEDDIRAREVVQDAIRKAIEKEAKKSAGIFGGGGGLSGSKLTKAIINGAQKAAGILDDPGEHSYNQGLAEVMRDSMGDLQEAVRKVAGSGQAAMKEAIGTAVWFCATFLKRFVKNKRIYKLINQIIEKMREEGKKNVQRNLAAMTGSPPPSD